MSTPQQIKLNEMLNSIPEQTADLASNISELIDIRDEFNEQINAIQIALLDVAANRLIAFLMGKASSLENGYTYKGLWETGTSYNIGETVMVATDVPVEDSTSIIPIDSTGSEGIDTSDYDSLHYQALLNSVGSSSTYPPDAPTYWDQIPLNLTNYRVATKSGFNSTNLTAWGVQTLTYVPPVPPAIIGTYVWVDVYTYASAVSGGDTQVTDLVSDWNYGYDLLTKELGTDGTYGLIPQRDNINVAINLLTINKNKLEGGLSVYPNYI